MVVTTVTPLVPLPCFADIRRMDYTPEQEERLKAYLDTDLNIDIYEDMTGQFDGFYEPLDFLDTIYEGFYFFEKNRDSYLDITRFINEQELDGVEKRIYLYYLSKVIRYHFEDPSGNMAISSIAIKSLGYIESCFKKLSKELSGDETNEVTAADVKPTANDNPTEQPSKPNLPYTNSQLVLIFYYFLKSAGLEIRKELNIATAAKFMHLITGKPFTESTHSEFYKKLQAAPNEKSDKELIKDLEVIKPLFEAVKLNDATKLIEQEIEIAKTENKGRK